CGNGISEAAFVAKSEGISYREALVFIQRLEDAESSEWTIRQQNLQNNLPLMDWLSKTGIENQIVPLRLGYTGAGVDFPVFVYGQLLDVRNYLADRNPKVMSQAKATNLILPFDLWRE